MPRGGAKNRKKHKNGLKHCQKCKEWKPLSEYFGDNSRWDHLATRCKECNRELQRKFPPGVGAKLRGIKLRQPYNDKGEKLCSACGQWKKPEQFEKRKDAWDGRRANCRKCLNQQRRNKYVKKGRAKKRGKYNMTVAGAAAISRAAYDRWVNMSAIKKATFIRTVRDRWIGSGNPNWKGGISCYDWRNTSELRWWRKKVLERDKYTCQRCGRCGKKGLHAHHIKPVGDCPNLVICVENGVTLCEDCHIVVHKELRNEIIKDRLV